MALWLAVGTTACSGDFDEPPAWDVDFAIPRTTDFAATLSGYGLFEEPMASLRPAAGVHLYELSSDLFTDHAHKQRLIRIPEDTLVTSSARGRLEFPDGTIVAKTFYYPADMGDPDGPRRVIETRLLVLADGRWNVATYLWTDDQTDAVLLLDGRTTDVSWTDEQGQSLATEYHVPHEGECVTCHQNNGVTDVIGPTLRNMNRTVVRGGVEVNQLDHLVAAGVFEVADPRTAPSIADDTDDSLPLDERARAWLDMNCAHCHRPGGWDEASRPELDLRAETPRHRTGIDRTAREMQRQLRTGRMPFLGTTLQDDEGIRLVSDFLESL